MPRRSPPAAASARALPAAHIRAALLTIVLGACAKDPPSTAVPYDGAIPTGSDQSASVDHVDLTIDPTQVGRAISPLIYGYNAISDPGARGVSVLRAGGNRFTAYNWENNASNAGNDYMFQNDGFLVMGDANPDTPGEAVRPMLTTAGQIGASAIVTIPIVDYVSADKQPPGPVTNSGADYLTTRFKQNLPTRGSAPVPGTPPDITDGFVYEDEFVAWVGAQFPALPVLFSLDNEPDLWSSTHKEIHPAALTYDELIRRNVDYATAIKAVRPDAAVLGFVSYGWQGYVSLQNAPDAVKGNFIDYYLGQMRAAETSHGQRLVDYLDLHWYPEATGLGASGSAVRITGSDVSPGVVAARVQAPRSLWDPSYQEQSWIAGAVGGPISLVPRIEGQIAKGYPGTKLSFSEWNYGGGSDISGAVATADVLGIFGREGVALATVWPSGSEPFTEAAVAIYRNYDGAGARFGDTSVSAQTSSIQSSSVYAAIDAANPSRLVIVAINRRSAPTTATIHIAGAPARTAAAIWVVTGSSPVIQPGSALTTTEPGTFTYSMPALSVTVIVPS
jgi:Glycoside hydrolase family 44